MLLLVSKKKMTRAGIANASNQLGHVCLARKEYESALNHYQQALAICDKSNDRMSILAVLPKIVEVHKALKQYDMAIEICLIILDHYHDNRDPQGTVTILEEMAEIYLKAEKKRKLRILIGPSLRFIKISGMKISPPVLCKKQNN